MFRQLMTKTSQYTKTYSAVRSFAASASGSSGAEPPKPLNHVEIPIVDFQDPDYLPIPEYPVRLNEPLHDRKQRLLYQSRKRGMLENDLLLSTFAHKYLKSMTEQQVVMYDQLINGVSNDWDIFYWATNTKPTPDEYNNEIMQMLKEHAKNTKKENRCRQPDLV